jgi:glycosyltransferase involved in cell wall biosynthesis
MPTLSVILITKNEAANIRDCLNSVSFADEIIVLDSGSTDSTVELCRSFTQQVFRNADWQGFGVQKNRALNQAQGEWILSIDADERVTPALRAEIQQIIQHPMEVAFRIPRCSYYCGRWIKHSGWQPDYVTRLFRRDSARFSNDLVHEQVQLLSGKIGTLQNPLLHYSFTSLEEVLDKINHYSSASAHTLKDKGQPSSLKKAIVHGLWTFVRTYFLKRGFLDGREGFLLAVSNAEGTYYRYLKLMYLQEHVNHKCNSDHL